MLISTAGKARLRLWLCLIALFSAASMTAAEYHGQVTFNGLGVPGVTVTALRGDRKQITITDAQGAYSFYDLADGVWNIQIEMQAFYSIQQDVTVGSSMEAGRWELKLLPLDQIQAVEAPTAAAAASPTNNANTNKGAPPAPTNIQTPFQRTELNASGAVPQQELGEGAASGASANESFGGQNPADLDQRAADGFLINGTANNSASSPFTLGQAFGNNRRGPRSLYNGSFGFILDNSALDARSYSLTGQDTPKPAYNRMTGTFSFGGPLRIPHLVHNGPNFFIGYQIARNRNAQTQSGLVPTLAERNGDLSQAPGLIFDPLNNLAFAGNQIPLSRISQQARSLLNLYPLPNFTGSTRYNYQVPVVSTIHQDGVQVRMNKTTGRNNQISGTFGLQSVRSDNPTLLGFLDTNRSLGSNLVTSWLHRFTQHFFTNLNYQFSRQSARTVPFFENSVNISGLAGISGNNQEPVNWGPPALNFWGGLTSLSDAVPSATRNQTSSVSDVNLWTHGRHNVSFGGDFRRQQFNSLSQQNPRGSFTFTGASTLGNTINVILPGARNDFAGFLLSIPDALSIAFGNADKYFRTSSYDAYIADDWRVNPSLTVNVGVRWEYWAPITELYGRLVNLDISPGFPAVAPVVAKDPTGTLTGATYPDSLLHPDKHAFQPRVGFSWRPWPASSMIVRGGYGVYYNSSPYLSIATQMAQQSPLSKSLMLQNTATAPLTLASGFNASPNTVTNTFAVDPNLRVGYSQTWQLSVQRDFPGALQLTATYLGIKGTRGTQELLPNTYPIGAVNPCPSCPSGFTYMASNGNSTREAGTIQLRRRLHSGFTATMQYTFSKSIDDAALGGRGQASAVIAQDWLNLSGERSLSSFDQRHAVSLQVMYTSGMGIAGGTLVNGWRGALFKEWTIASQITAGSGFPLTPVYPLAVVGTGVTGPVRPDITGAAINAPPEGLYLNPAAYKAPATGHWGNAGRDSITGPAQFSLNASLSRTFRMSDRISLDLRVDATNALNHVTFPSWNTTVGSAQFGLPAVANSMRSLQTTARWRF